MSGRLAARNRYVRAGYAATEATAGAVRRAARSLWLQITGLLFMTFAIVLIGATWREYGRYAAGEVGSSRPAMAAAFALLFLWFGLSAFWKARR